MPAGVSWSTYLKFSAAAYLAMFCGSHAVYLYYKPLKDLEEYVNRELESRKKTS